MVSQVHFVLSGDDGTTRVFQSSHLAGAVSSGIPVGVHAFTPVRTGERACGDREFGRGCPSLEYRSLRPQDAKYGLAAELAYAYPPSLFIRYGTGWIES